MNTLVFMENFYNVTVMLRNKFTCKFSGLHNSNKHFVLALGVSSGIGLAE